MRKCKVVCAKSLPVGAELIENKREKYALYANDCVSILKGVGPAKVKNFKRYGIHTIEELLTHEGHIHEIFEK